VFNLEPSVAPIQRFGGGAWMPYKNALRKLRRKEEYWYS